MFRSLRPSSGSSCLSLAKVTIVKIFGKTRRYIICSGVAAATLTVVIRDINAPGLMFAILHCRSYVNCV
jgi:hypothetical protein